MSRLFFTNEENEGKAEGLKLISPGDDGVEVIDEGAKILEDLGDERPVNLAFIFGNARSGKSYMMNCLSGTQGLFKVINSSTPCTTGADISSLLIPHDRLAQQVDGEPNSDPKQDPLVGFVDVEGMGDQGDTYDTILSLPLLMTSKVVLFNHKGAPTVHDMLGKLGVLARAAKFIQLSEDGKDDAASSDDEVESSDDDSDDSDSDDDDDDSNDENKEDLSKYKKGDPDRKKPPAFGHLHIVFRDFSFDASDDEVYEQLLSSEKVPKPVKGKKGPAAVAANNERKSIQERNKIRKLVLKNFASVNVWLFKQPADSADLKAHTQLPEDLVDPEFKDMVTSMLGEIVEQTKEPSIFKGKNLTGVRLASLIRQATEAASTRGAINVPSMFKAMEQEAVVRIGKQQIDLFITSIEKLAEQLPIPQAQLEQELNTLLTRAVERFYEALADCSLIEAKEAQEKRMRGDADAAIKDLIADNKQGIIELLETEIQASFEDATSAFILFCDEVIPVPKVGLLTERHEQQKLQARESVKANLDKYPTSFELEEYKTALFSASRAFDDVYNLKVAQNEAKVKDKQISQLNEENERSQREIQAQLDKMEELKRAQEEKEKRLRDELEAAKFNPKRDGGFLEKRGKFNTSFQARWFRIKGSKLKYFKSPKDTSPRGEIELKGAELYAELPANDPDYQEHGDHCFIVHVAATGRNFKLRAQSPKEKTVWVQVIQELISSL